MLFKRPARLIAPLLRGCIVFTLSLALVGFGLPPSQPLPLQGVFEATAQLPAFAGLEKITPDVCQDGSCPYSTVSDAVKYAFDGAVIVVAPGYYDDCVVTGPASVAIIGLVRQSGARATFRKACAGKAAFVVSSQKFLLQGVRIEGIQVRDKNGACLRLEGRSMAQQVAIVDVECSASENGILGNVGSGTLVVRASKFIRNGGNNGFSHGIYVDGGAEVFIDGTVIAETKGKGHTLKVGAKRLIVEGSTLAALNGRNSRAIDYYGGGVLSVRASVIQQGPLSDNHDSIAIGMERARLNADAVHAAQVSDSWIVYDAPSRCCRWLFAGKALGRVTVKGTRMVALNGSPLEYEDGGANQVFNTRADAGLPPYNARLSSMPTP